MAVLTFPLCKDSHFGSHKGGQETLESRHFSVHVGDIFKRLFSGATEESILGAAGSCDRATRTFCTEPTRLPVLCEKPGSPESATTVTIHPHHNGCGDFWVCYIPCVPPCALQRSFLSLTLHMQEPRLKAILVCLEPVTRLASSGGGTPAPTRAPSAPSYSASLAPGVTTWVKDIVFRATVASPNSRGGIGWGMVRLWEGRSASTSKCAKAAGAARPEIWRQKSESVVKSAEQKAPC